MRNKKKNIYIGAYIKINVKKKKKKNFFLFLLYN